VFVDARESGASSYDLEKAMSASDDQPATVPPPAGEDDAYSAATKVGAMPAELLAKLRAEGLLPEESDEPTRLAPRPALPVDEPMGLPPTSSPAPISDGKVPVLYSTAPPADGQGVGAPGEHARPAEDVPPPSSLQAYETSPVLETPVAFTATPEAPAGKELTTRPEDSSTIEDDARAFGGRLTRGQLVYVVVAALIAVVGLLFIMALSSQRR
jgi:hypothetical protein